MAKTWFGVVFVLALVWPLLGQERTKVDSEVLRKVDSEVLREGVERVNSNTNTNERLLEAAELNRVTRAQLNVDTLPSQVSELRFTDLEGREVKEQLSPQVVGNRLSVSTETLKQFVIKPDRLETIKVERPERIKLPGGIVTAEQADPGGGGSALDWLRLTFLASPLPAVWDQDRQQYSTRVTFGLEPQSERAARQELERPVTVRVSYEGLVADQPPDLRIGGAGIDREESFNLAFRPTTASPKLKVRSTISDVDLELRAVPRLDLRAAQSEILGFGLEQVTFTLSEILPHGEIARTEEPMPITVSVEGRAEVKPKQPVFDTGPATSQFTVRSAGLGPLDVTASVGGSAAIATVRQNFPVGPLIAVLLGGALGGFARRYVKGAQKRKTGRWVAEGLVVGVIAFVAGVLGVGYLSLPAAVVATEAGAFLTGAICGFVGVVVIEKLTGSLSRA